MKAIQLTRGMAYLDSPNKSRKYLGYRKTREEAALLLQEARNEEY